MPKEGSKFSFHSAQTYFPRPHPVRTLRPTSRTTTQHTPHPLAISSPTLTRASTSRYTAATATLSGRGGNQPVQQQKPVPCELPLDSCCFAEACLTPDHRSLLLVSPLFQPSFYGAQMSAATMSSADAVKSTAASVGAAAKQQMKRSNSGKGLDAARKQNASPVDGQKGYVAHICYPVSDDGGLRLFNICRVHCHWPRPMPLEHHAASGNHFKRHFSMAHFTFILPLPHDFKYHVIMYANTYFSQTTAALTAQSLARPEPHHPTSLYPHSQWHREAASETSIAISKSDQEPGSLEYR